MPILHRKVVPNVPALAADNGKIVFRAGKPSHQAEMKIWAELDFDVPFSLELPADTVAGNRRWHYEWTNTPPATFTKTDVNAALSSAAKNVYYNALRVTNGNRLRTVFDVEGFVGNKGTDDRWATGDFNEVEVTGCLVWQQNLAYWEWFTTNFQIHQKWRWTATATDLATGAVTTVDGSEDKEIACLQTGTLQSWPGDAAICGYCQGQSTTDLRPGPGITLYPNNISDGWGTNLSLLNGTTIRFCTAYA